MTNPPSDPGDSLGPEERSLLRAGRERKLDPAVREELWEKINAAISGAPEVPTNPAVDPAASSPPAPISGAAAQGAGPTAAIVAGAVGVAVLAGWLLHEPAAAPASPPISAATATRMVPTATAAPQIALPPLPPLPRTETPREAPPVRTARVPSGSTTAGGAPPAPSASASVSAMDLLREESALLTRARAALHGGNPGGALQLLADAGARFPRGVLGQEREALTIEALSRSGQSADAARRAEAFLKAHPTSPYAARMRGFAVQGAP